MVQRYNQLRVTLTQRIPSRYSYSYENPVISNHTMLSTYGNGCPFVYKLRPRHDQVRGSTNIVVLVLLDPVPIDGYNSLGTMLAGHTLFRGRH